MNAFSSPIPPSIRSVAVATGGGVAVYWISPVDTGTSFYNYTLYRSSTIAGPYTAVTSVGNYFQTSFIDNSINATLSVYYYYLTTKSDCCIIESVPSDTLNTMKLNVVNSGNGIAYLSWNAVHTPLLPTASAQYRIFCQYPTEGWKLLDSAQQSGYLDTTVACTEQVNYRIEQSDNSGSVSVSSPDGDVFRDLIPPPLTVIDTVSVDPFTGDVSISWLTNATKDTKGYIVYRFNGISWDSISTVYGYNNNSYLYTGASAGNASERYTLATIDSCNNSTGFSIDHSTIFLKAVINKCARAIDLNWTPYFNMTAGVKSYKIFVSKNSEPYQAVGTVDYGTSTFSYVSLNADSTYCFYVQAVGNVSNRTASSNSICVVASVFKEPAFTYIRSASVAGNSINILCYVDSTAEIESFTLLRSESAEGSFESVTTINYNGAAQFSFIDNAAITDKSYYYQIESEDSCGNSLSKSNVAKTIFVKSMAENNFINTITWNDYEGWADGIEYFIIFRKLSPTAPSIYLASVPADVHAYCDDITEYYKEQGQFCYSIRAVEKSFSPYSFIDSSLSNETCNWQIPLTFTPNAFHPFGINPVFYPVNVFVDMSSYSFRVFNRWGAQVFESSNPKDGWNGNFKGKPVSQGMYVFYISYTDNTGNEIKKRGTVTLVR